MMCMTAHRCPARMAIQTCRSTLLLHSLSLNYYSEEQGLISLSTFSQMEELIHRRMIWSILQSLHPSYVYSLEKHDNVLHLQHLISPLQRHHRKKLDFTKVEGEPGFFVRGAPLGNGVADWQGEQFFLKASTK